MFVNFTNHPSAKWEAAQREAATYHGSSGIVDRPFPNVSPTATSRDIYLQAKSIAMAILIDLPYDEENTVLCQGEMTLAFAVVQELKAAKIKCVAATTERVVTEGESGVKQATFKFVQFREF